MKHFFAILFFLVTQSCYADIRLPALVSDDMILQREMPLHIWGWADIAEKVSIRFRNKTYKTIADAKGNWKIDLPAQKAGGPYDMTLQGQNRIELKNILIGDVWFCSGQSNMQHQMHIHPDEFAKEIETANNSEIRQFLVPMKAVLTGLAEDVDQASWKTVTPQNIKEFSVVAYFFAKNLYQQYHVPIGIINASVGGTPIEAWMSEGALQNFPDAKKLLDRNKDTAFVENNNRTARAYIQAQPVPVDPGMQDEIKWYIPNFDDSNWNKLMVPGFWEDQGLKDLDGTVWYRRNVTLSQEQAAGIVKVYLGRIVDADEVYVNGQSIGRTTYQYPQRRYQAAPGIFHEGTNNITVRITNYGGKGGFVPGKPCMIIAGNDSISIAGYWKYKVANTFSPGDKNAPREISKHLQPAALYNGMLGPLLPYTAKGFVWYQGESNTGSGAAYTALQNTFIEDLRTKTGQPSLPVLFVQLPNFMDRSFLPQDTDWARIRDAQSKSLSLSHTGMAVAIDLGEWNDIHPDHKDEVGRRLSLAARHIAYGEDIVYSGPTLVESTFTDARVELTFGNIGSGLMFRDDDVISNFAVAGANKIFHWASATISGNKVIITNAPGEQIMYVRYAWADNPGGMKLYNREGLPAAPFRTQKLNQSLE